MADNTTPTQAAPAAQNPDVMRAQQAMQSGGPAPASDTAAAPAAPAAGVHPDIQRAQSALTSMYGSTNPSPDVVRAKDALNDTTTGLMGQIQQSQDPEEIKNLYLDNEELLSPQHDQIAQAYDSALKAPLTASGVAAGVKGQVSGLGQMLGESAFDLTPMGFQTKVANYKAQGSPNPREDAMKETYGEVSLALENAGVDVDAATRKVIRSIAQEGVQKAASMASKSPLGIAESVAQFPLSLAEETARKITGTAPTPATTVQGDILHPSNFLAPETPASRFDSDLEVARTARTVAAGQGVANKGTLGDPEYAAKLGIQVDPEVAKSLAQTGELASMALVSGLKPVAAEDGSIGIVNGAGRQIAVAPSMDAAKAAIQATGKAITKTADVLQAGRAKIATAIGAPIKKLTSGAGLAKVVGLGALSESGLLDELIPKSLMATAGKVAAGGLAANVATKLGLKAVGGIGKVLSSDAGSSILGAGAHGAATGAAAMAPFAATADNRNQAAASLLTGAVLGGTAGAGAAGAAKVAEGLSHMGQIGHTEIFKNVQPNPAARVAMNVPGMEAFEKAHQDTMNTLDKANPVQAALVNAQRDLLASKGIQSYTVTPTQAKSLGLPEAEGASNHTVTDSTGKPQQINFSVLNGDDIKSISHEPGHPVASYAAANMPVEWNDFLKSIPDDVRQKFIAKYTADAAGNPEVQAAMKRPGYMDQELGAEVLGHYLSDSLQEHAPLSMRQNLNRLVGTVLEKMGVLDTTIKPGTAGATKGYGIIPSNKLGDIAQTIVDRYKSNGAVGPALKTMAAAPEEVTPQVTPEAPAESPLTPQHEAVLNGMRKVLSPKAMLRFDDIAAKVKAGQPLTPAESGLWEGVDAAAVKAGATPSPTPPTPVKAPPVSGEPEKPIVSTPGATPTAPKARPATTDEGRLNAAQNIEAGVKELGAAKETTPEQKAAYESLASGGAHEVVYSHAKGELGGQEQRSEVVNSKEARQRTNPESQQLTSKLTMLDMRKTKEGKWQQQFFNHDVLGQNMEVAVKAVKAAGLEKEIPYHVGDRGVLPIDRERFNEDLRKYTENQHNGYKGDGGKLERPTGGKAYIPEETPGYKPQKLSDPKASDFLNLLMGERPPKTTIVRPKGSYPVHLEHQDIALANKGVVHPIEGLSYKDIKGRSVANTTDLRNKLAKAGQDVSDMKPVHEWKNAERVMSAKPVAGEANIAAPVTATTGAGFLPKLSDVPEAERGPGDEVTIRKSDGTEYQAKYLGNVGGRDWVGRAAEGPRGPAVSHGLLAKDEKIVSGSLHSSNFMPNNSPRAIKEAAVRNEKTGKIYTGAYHAEANMKYLEEKNPGDPSNDARAWGMIDKPAYGMKSGFMTHGGEFLDREQAFKRALELQQYTPRVSDLKKGELEAVAFAKQQKLTAMGYDMAHGNFLPKAKDEVRKVAADYMHNSGMPYRPYEGYATVNEPLMKRIADHFEASKSNLTDPKVKGSYEALAKEAMDQYKAMTAAGYKIEPYEGKGEPYKSSEDMLKDVHDNKHLYFLKTEGNFGAGSEATDNPMLKSAGVTAGGHKLLVNDVFRAVHDFFGHAKEGYQFGPRGEFNAWRSHSTMFSPEAQGALAAETLGQNAWVNFGKHLRNEAGEIPKKGEAGYVAPTERPFAEQKNFTVSPALRNEASFLPAQNLKDAPALHEFEDEKTLPAAVAKPHWAGMTATQEKLGPHDNAANTQANDNLETELKEGGYPFKEVGGKYKGVEQGKGFLISPIAEDDALRLANKYKQESIITPRGMRYTDGTLAPTVPEKLKVGKEAEKQDFYATQKNGPSFAIATDESKRSLSPSVKRKAAPKPESKQVAEGGIPVKRRSAFLPNKNPRAIKAAAVLDEQTGEVQEGRNHAEAADHYLRGHPDRKGNTLHSIFVTNSGEKLSRDEAFKRGLELKQISPEMAYMEPGTGPGSLRPAFHEDFGFMPKQNVPATSGWILPNGKFSQLEHGSHEEDLSANAADYNKRFKTNFTTGEYGDETRRQALNAGFVRIRNYEGNTSVEANPKVWAKNKTAILDHLLANKDDIDSLRVNLIHDDGQVADSVASALFREKDKGAAIENILDSVNPNYRPRVEPSDIQRARALPGEGEGKTSFLPKEQAEDLFGNSDERRETDVRKMTPAQLTKQFPEIIKPTLSASGSKEQVPYNLEAAPLVKGLKTSDQKSDAYADKLVNEARKLESTPEYQSGLNWYSEFVPKLKKWFDGHSDLFAELLAATSPRTNPTVNFGYAAKAFEGWLKGEYKPQVDKFNEGMQKIQDGSIADWYKKNTAKADQIKDPTPDQYMAAWIDENKLVPTQWGRKAYDPFNGEATDEDVKYGMHGTRILKVLARQWMDSNQGPKVAQFVRNLTGVDHGATIDVWAARTLRRLGYDIGGKRWRLLPEMEGAVTDNDFKFGQEVFSKAAAKLGVKPDALQGAMWFAEKKRWAANGWGRLDYGDFRKELENFITRRKYNAAQAGLFKDEVVPVSKVQSTAPVSHEDLAPTTKSLFDIRPKKG